MKGITKFKAPGMPKGNSPGAPMKTHPAALQARVRLPQGANTPSDPAMILPNVGKI